MDDSLRPSSLTAAGAPIPAKRGGTLFLPKEHGSWSLALEPIALGILVAPSRAGIGLAVAAAAGFFSRRPLKLAFTAERTDRRSWARGTLATFGVLAAAGLIEAGILGGLSSLWPLGLVGVLGGFFLCLDMAGESRRSAAEVAGASAFSFMPAAFATLSGWTAWAALSLSLVMLSRSVPTVLMVRAYLRLGKGQACSVIPAIGVATASALGIFLWAWLGLVPAWVCPIEAVLLVRICLILTALRSMFSARRLGFTEAIIGLLFIVTVALAYRG